MTAASLLVSGPAIAFAQAAPPAGSSSAAPPAAAASSAATAPSAGASATAPPAEPPIQEVTVRGARQAAPGGQEVTSRDVKQMPGAFGDAFRAIEALPGVTPLVSGVPYFLVRGAPPGNTGFFIDGVRVPALFHLGVGTAVVHPSLIDRVDFYPGGYPARFGRYTGGILSGELAALPDRPHAEASLRLFDAGGLVSTPFAGDRGEVMASGRYGYPGPLVTLFDPDIGLSYWDYQSRISWKLDGDNEISAFAFGSFDSLTEKDPNTGQMDPLFGVQFHRLDLRWDRRTSATGHLRVALTLGYDQTSAGSTSSASPPSGGPGLVNPGSQDVVTAAKQDSIQSEMVALRADWSDTLSPELDARVGADAILSPYTTNLGDTGISGTLTTGMTGTSGSSASTFQQLDVNGGVYGELVWHVAPSIEVRPGLRADLFTSRESASDPLLGSSGTAQAVGAFDPRLATRWVTASWLTWFTSMGVAHQASNIPLPSPGLQFSQLSRGLQSSYQYAAGAEIELPLKFSATIDGFLQDYTGIADLYDNCPTAGTTCTFDGRAYGMELLVRRRLTERLTGWLSYTLSRSERDAYVQVGGLSALGGPPPPGSGIPPIKNEWVRTLSEFDRPHVVNAAVAADLGARWRAGARVIAYSGLPYSTTTGMTGILNAREPPFVRLDLRLEKKWQALGGTLTLVFEWLNALLSKESFGTQCEGGPVPTCQPVQIGPITVPSVGVEESW